MKYSLSPALAPFGRAIKYYYIQTRPHKNDTVSICAVIAFQPEVTPETMEYAGQQAIKSMFDQMENDLRCQAVDNGIGHCFWEYRAECHYVNP